MIQLQDIFRKMKGITNDFDWKAENFQIEPYKVRSPSTWSIQYQVRRKKPHYHCSRNGGRWK